MKTELIHPKLIGGSVLLYVLLATAAAVYGQGSGGPPKPGSSASLAGADARVPGSGAKLELNPLDRLAPKANEAVSINIDGALLQAAANFIGKHANDKGGDRDVVMIKELLAGLQGIYVKHFEFEAEGAYGEADAETVRAQLKAPGWSRILEARSRKEGVNAEVYVLNASGQIGGLTIISHGPKELTVVNIAGKIDLDKLSQLEGKFGIPQLELEQGGEAQGGARQEGSQKQP